MTEAQLEKLRKYLDDDCQAHLKAHGSWRLDMGKLMTAVEHAKGPEFEFGTIVVDYKVSKGTDAVQLLNDMLSTGWARMVNGGDYRRKLDVSFSASPEMKTVCDG